MYQATIQTGNDELGIAMLSFSCGHFSSYCRAAGTTGAIELTMTGAYRQTSPKMLLQGVKPGLEEKVAFRAADGDEFPWFIYAFTNVYMAVFRSW